MDANNTLNLFLKKNFLARRFNIKFNYIFIFNYVIILHIYSSIINNIVKFYYNVMF